VSLVVAPCSHDAAKYAVMNWHYSQKMPIGKLVKFGVWENEQFAGCVIYGRGASKELGRPYGCDITEVSELVRVALKPNHLTPVTQVVAKTIQMLKETNVKMRLVISFADTRQGHVGKIYQAGNWIYTGKSAENKEYLLEGKWLHSRMTGVAGFAKEASGLSALTLEQRRELPTRRIPGKHRYLYPLDRAMRRQVQRLALPYPSADEGSTVSHDTSGVEVQVRLLPSAQLQDQT
jgi:hypothetical protein